MFVLIWENSRAEIVEEMYEEESCLGVVKEVD